MSEQESRIQTYKEFWPYYLSEHQNPTNRRLHYTGTSLGIGLLIYSIATQKYLLILPALICGYAFAWVGHFIIEKNRPATFKYPLWSFISDFKMLYCALTGQLPKNNQG